MPTLGPTSLAFSYVSVALVLHLSFSIMTVEPTLQQCPAICTCYSRKDIIVEADCSGRHLQSVPIGLPGTLERLDLSGNQISSFMLENLTNFAQLQILNLRDNFIENLLSDTFARSPLLQFLDLSNNKINNLQPNSFRNLTSLRRLNLNNNSLPPLPGIFSDLIFKDLYNLKELDLQNNIKGLVNYSFCYPDVALSKLSNLEKLHTDGLPSTCIMGIGFRNLSNLRLLNFGNPFRHICQSNDLTLQFFSNITTLNDLEVDFLNCDIQTVDPGSFAHIPSLTRLRLAGNHYLYFDQFCNASASFHLTRLKILDISSINKHKGMVVLTPNYFQYLRNTSLEVLIMRNNLIIEIKAKVLFQLPPTLKGWDISDNSISKAKFLIYSALLVNLEFFNISVQSRGMMEENKRLSKFALDSEVLLSTGHTAAGSLKIDSFPQPISSVTFQESKKNPGSDNLMTSITIGQWVQYVSEYCPSYTPNIPESRYNDFVSIPHESGMKLFTRSNGKTREIIEKEMQLPFPRSLKWLDASHIHIEQTVNSVKITGNNVIKYINVSDNGIWCFGGPVSGAQSLNVLDLSNNHAIALSPMFFHDMVHLTSLILSSNSIGLSLGIDSNATTFATLTKLEHLDLKSANIHKLLPNVFRSNTHIKTLILSNNALYDSLPLGSHLAHLEYLDLSFNSLPGLSEQNMKQLDEIQKSSVNITVNLLGNPLKCDCSTLAFLQWYKTTGVVFLYHDQYHCEFVNGSVMLMEYLDDYAMGILYRVCNGQSSLIVAIILFCAMMIVGTAMAVFSFYQVKLLYYVHLSKKRFFCHYFELEQRRLPINDVFLVFDDQDSGWRSHVLSILIPNLSLKGISYHVSEVGICQPSAGRRIWEVIEEAILCGRKTLVLLTEDVFMDDENQLAVTMSKIIQDMTGRQKLIFLGAQKLKASSLPVYLFRLLRSSRIVRYLPDDPVFWTQLKNEIKNRH